MCSAGERDLRGARQVEAVAPRARRCSTRSVGKKPVPYIASSRTSTGGSTGVKPCAARRSSAKPVEREREQRRVADAGSRSASRTGARRAPCSKRPISRSLLRRRRASAARRQRRISTGVLLGVAVRGRRRAAGSGRASSSAVARGLGRGELVLEPPAARPSPRCSSSSCSGVGLPFSFVAARSSSTRGTSARQRSSAASSASNASRGALARERGAEAVGIRARCPEVDHALESRKASITWATPSSSRPGRRSRRARAAAGARSRPRRRSRPSRAARRRSRRRRTRPCRSRREAEPLGDEREPRPFVTSGFAELEEVRAATSRCTAGRRTAPASRACSAVELGRVADGDELRRRLREPVEQSPDRVTGMCWKSAYGARPVRCPRRRRARRRRSS